MARKVDELILDTFRKNIGEWLSVSTGTSVFSYNFPDLETFSIGSGPNNNASIVLPKVALVIQNEYPRYNNYYPIINKVITPGVSTEYLGVGEYHAEVMIAIYYSTRDTLNNAKNILWQNLLYNKSLELLNDPVSGHMQVYMNRRFGFEEYTKDIKCYKTFVKVYCPLYYESTGYVVKRADLFLFNDATGSTNQQITSNQVSYLSDTQYNPMNPAFRRVINGDNLSATFSYSGPTPNANFVTGVYNLTGEAINDLSQISTVTEVIAYSPDVATTGSTIENPVITGYNVTVRGTVRPDKFPNTLTKWQLCLMSDDLETTITKNPSGQTITYLYQSDKYNLTYQIVESYSSSGLTTITGYIKNLLSVPISSLPNFTDYQTLLGANGLRIQRDPATGTSITSTVLTGFNFIETVTTGTATVTGLVRQKYVGAFPTLFDITTGNFSIYDNYERYGLYDLIRRTPDLYESHSYNSSGTLTGTTLTSSGYALTGQIVYTTSGSSLVSTFNVTSGQHAPITELLDNFYLKSSLNEYVTISGTTSPTYSQTTAISLPVMNFLLTKNPVWNSDGTISSINRFLTAT